MLIAAFILVISTAATVQFVVFSWRAGLLSVASESLTSEVGASAAISHKLLHSNELQGTTAFQELCPDLSTGQVPKLGSVRLYYRFLQFLRAQSNGILSPAVAILQREMDLCTRYAAVVISQRVLHNQTAFAEVRSY